jgi:dTDP-4-dehydro-6-deoxy-alpha-D-glucopyranose 2,3-dehydratase
MHSIDYDVLKTRYELHKAYPKLDESALDLLISALTEYNPGMPTAAILDWLARVNSEVTFEIRRVPVQQIGDWYLDDRLNLRHNSGRFFSIEGIRVHTNTGHVRDWSQPIIHQPEVGILGILCQKQHGILYFLMQAKIEPGNVNQAQLSPTVQATKSNYTQVHGGNRPPYLEHFVDLSDKRIIVDQLQSEQGARFLKKRNRNMIVEIDSETPVHLLSNYCWLTLGQIKHLMCMDNIINMDSRTVLSCAQLNFRG